MVTCWIHGISLKDHVRSEEMRKRVKVKPIENSTTISSIVVLCHSACCPDASITLTIYEPEQLRCIIPPPGPTAMVCNLGVRVINFSSDPLIFVLFSFCLRWIDGDRPRLLINTSTGCFRLCNITLSCTTSPSSYWRSCCTSYDHDS